MMHPDCKKILVSEEEIISRVRQMGKEISDYYRDSSFPLLVVGLLKGSVPFLAELIKRIDLDLEIDFMDVSSYQGISSSEIVILKDIDTDIVGKDILIVEDIVDTGKTLRTVCDLLKSKGAHSVRVATLLDKPEGRKIKFDADFVGFVIPNEFVIGYGLDYNQKYRSLPYIGVIKEEAI